MADKYLAALRALPPAAHGPRVDVTFTDVSLELTVPVADSGLSNLALATARFFTSPFTSVPTRRLQVLTGVSGTLRAGTSTLILGNGGGGKTSLLRRLAARDGPGSSAPGVFGGSVQWNGAAPPPTARKVAAFAPQIDIHEPLLTVRETLEFAAASCLAALPSDASPAEVALRAALVDHVLDTLELRECESVILGDDLKRGVSGGQKKRVTLGEALLQGARILALDEVTNGLDSATAAKVCVFLGDWARATGGTVIAALQAPTPEIVRAFDSVLVLSDGHVLYHGPPGDLRAYLSARGYECPSFMDIADYALAFAVSPSYVLTTFPAPPGTPPATATTREALAAEWTVAAAVVAAAASKTAASPVATGGLSLESPRDNAQFGKLVAHSATRHMSLLVSRQSKLVKRNPAVSVGRVFQFILLGAIFGSVYYKIALDNFVTKMSLCMFSAAAVSFASFAEIPVIFTGKRVAGKQLDGAFYSPSAYVLSVIVNALPASFLSTCIFATIMYWMVGFAEDAGRYFFFVLALVAHEQCTSALFRLYAFFLPSEELCQAAAGISTGAMLIFGGFYIAYSKIPPFMWPVYYISPFSWTVRSMVNSEFTADAYATPVPGGPTGTQTIGDLYLGTFGFFKGLDWKWGGIAMTLSYAVLLGPILSSIAVTYVRARERPGSQRISESAFLEAAAKSADAVRALVASPSKPTLVLSDIAPEGASPSPASSPAAVAPTSPTSAAAASALPFEPITLSFAGVKYTVTLPDKEKTQKCLLSGVSGIMKPGSMTALMGASGAGKTTLLDVLAFRKTSGIVEGTFFLNGSPAKAPDFAARAAFAEQEDIHADYSTVREAIAFSAALRLPTSISAQSRDAFVDEVLTLLELMPIAGRRTGSLALGERKRLTIGVELASNPPVLFLDEPTTGLDARAASVVVRVIRNVAVSGRTVVATIHQPSAEVFFAFDELLLLAPGGHQVYAGPLGVRSASLAAFLGAVPGVSPLPPGVNPASWMLESLSSSSSGSGDAEAPRVDVRAAFVASSQNSAVVEGIAALALAPTPLVKPPARPGFATAVSVLTSRMASYMWRNTLWNGLRLFTFSFLAIFFGLLYLRIDDSDQAGAFSKMAVMLNSIIFVSIITLNTAIPNFAQLRPVFYRERSAGFYHAAAYPLSLSATEAPATAFFALVFMSINYFLVGFVPTAGAFFTAYLSIALSAFWFATIGAGFIAFFPIPLLASIAGGMMIQFTILFGGINIPVSGLAGWSWFYYANGFAHALRLAFLPQYEGNADKILINRDDIITKEAFETAQLGLAPIDKWQALGCLAAIVFGGWVLMVFFYARINHQKK